MNELTDFEMIINGVAQLAAVIRSYYNTLIESGFCHEDAMALTLQFQKETIDLAKTNNNKDK